MIGAICLNHQLQYEGSDLSTSFANKYHNKLWNKLTNAWDMTKFVDYTLDTTEPAIGETRESGANLRWLFKRLDELEMAGVSVNRIFGPGRPSSLCMTEPRGGLEEVPGHPVVGAANGLPDAEYSWQHRRPRDSQATCQNLANRALVFGRSRTSTFTDFMCASLDSVA